MISNNKKRTPTQSMNLVNELPRRALAVCCLLLVVSNVPNTSLAQDARYHYQLMQDVASQQQLGQTAYSLADPSDASLLMADLFNSFGGGSSPSELATRPHQERAKPVEGPNQREQTPGHYEFEVAPKMEPPGAPKPPFKQASNSCPGSGE